MHLGTPTASVSDDEGREPDSGNGEVSQGRFDILNRSNTNDETTSKDDSNENRNFSRWFRREASQEETSTSTSTDPGTESNSPTPSRRWMFGRDLSPFVKPGKDMNAELRAYREASDGKDTRRRPEHRIR